jgi:benzil reductase ((S)-benzoin forming)
LSLRLGSKPTHLQRNSYDGRMNPSSLPHLTIITGASRGMGLAMARQLLKPGDTVLCISRTAQTALAEQATDTGTTLLQWTHDLADGASLNARLQAWLGEMASTAWASASLINNAGMIPRIGPLSASDPVDLARALRVGLEAPMQLTAAFLHATEGWPGQRKVLNISSGLGRRAISPAAWRWKKP